MANDTVNLTEMSDVSAILRLFEEHHVAPTFDPVPYLSRLAELLETETENYLKMDPDPFDDRNPSRNPNCSFGHMLKIIFKKEIFMQKLVGDYLRDTYWTRLGISTRDSRELNTAAARLVLDLMPGLEVSVVFQDTEGLINRLFSWAEKGPEPLQSYATGLLAAAMELQDLAANFRELNAHLAPLMLKRLWEIQKRCAEEKKNDELGKIKRFSKFSSDQPSTSSKTPKNTASSKSRASSSSKVPKDEDAELMPGPEPADGASDKGKLPKNNKAKKFQGRIKGSKERKSGNASLNGSAMNDSSNSSWAEMESYVIGTYQMHPLTDSTRQILILRYLTPMGEYQELLVHMFEQKALDLILNYIDFDETQDSRLSFEALKYLGALLCHKKFAIEFIHHQGLHRLLEIPRPSIAATGVAMCLYYIAYCEDAMERVCLLPDHVIQELVRYALWLLECSHESGRCHATMFFGTSFQFRIILEQFDAQDGLRRLYNMISTLSILSMEDASDLLDDDESHAARQTVRHVCAALKRYFEIHLAGKVEHLQRIRVREMGGSPHPSTPPYKAIKLNADQIIDLITTAQELLPFRASWSPVNEFVSLGGIPLLLQVIAISYLWNFTGRAETVRSALDVLAVCSVSFRVQMLFCDRIQIPDDANAVGINILLGAAEGDIVADPEVQRAALCVLIHCVCAPVHRVGGSVGRFNGSAKRRSVASRTSEEVLNQVWECVRSHNGIMVLMDLLSVKTPITDADSIRALACKALLGLARSENARQIMGKLPLFTSGQLQVLMREPVLQDKRQEHVKFQKFGLELLEQVSGRIKSNVNEFELSLAKIHKADVVAQTRIQFNEKQLLQLIHQHLLSKNMVESASILMKEAGLPPLPLKQASSNFPPYRATGNTPSTPSRTGRVNSQGAVALPSTPVAVPSTSTPTQQMGIIKVNLSSSRRLRPGMPSPGPQPGVNSQHRALQKVTNWDSPTTMNKSLGAANVSTGETSRGVSLDAIVTEYLMNQHALCKTPMVTCPQFDLFQPHKCPDAKSKNTAPANFALRVQKRAIHPRFGGLDGARMDRKLVYSRFRPVRTFRNDSETFTCCAFSPCEQFLMIGNQTGELKLYNVNTAVEEATYQCHENYLFNIEPNWTGDLLLTSGMYRPPYSCLWAVGDFFDMKYSFEEEEYVEFSKTVQDKIVGTKGETATVYDVATGKKLLSLTPTTSNNYSKNRATFHPSDELILSDGVLWDAVSGTQIHKFDKLNQSLSGTFHPNGLEIISSSEVWDIRTYHLLRTVPTLDQCQVTFSASGDVIYAVHLEEESREEPMYDSSFKTLDAGDYSSIATIDVKRCIYGLCSNKYDTQIAVVENSREFNTPSESIVRLYDVGRLRDDEDVGSEVEEEEGDDDGGASENSDDDLEMLDELVNGGGDEDGIDVDIDSSDSSDDGQFGDSDDDDDDDDDDSNSYFGSSDEFDEELFSLNADSNSSGSSST
ncbi:DDB1- and CUL4-associated factor 1-like isoform X1 [Daphnia pulex]|uniref:DDB1- and CUL4-associated factor 1-like isoform X1 n=1 Tax=Daphnia pulex TaxID=6669 RepID=UPI001EE13A25|nr:DDB1- and CUL4-associated factor 1-like isoform X1 [Daphnia pulex]